MLLQDTSSGTSLKEMAHPSRLQSLHEQLSATTLNQEAFKNPTLSQNGHADDANGPIQAHKLDDVLDHTIYEANENIGGTWLVNTYPGVACDVPAHVYTFPFEVTTISLSTQLAS